MKPLIVIVLSCIAFGTIDTSVPNDFHYVFGFLAGTVTSLLGEIFRN